MHRLHEPHPKLIWAHARIFTPFAAPPQPLNARLSSGRELGRRAPVAVPDERMRMRRLAALSCCIVALDAPPAPAANRVTGRGARAPGSERAAADGRLLGRGCGAARAGRIAAPLARRTTLGASHASRDAGARGDSGGSSVPRLDPARRGSLEAKGRFGLRTCFP